MKPIYYRQKWRIEGNVLCMSCGCKYEKVNTICFSLSLLFLSCLGLANSKTLQSAVFDVVCWWIVDSVEKYSNALIFRLSVQLKGLAFIRSK